MPDKVKNAMKKKAASKKSAPKKIKSKCSQKTA